MEARAFGIIEFHYDDIYDGRHRLQTRRRSRSLSARYRHCYINISTLIGAIDDTHINSRHTLAAITAGSATMDSAYRPLT
jgi:hypothetical protein